MTLQKTWLNSGIILRGPWQLDERENMILLLPILIGEHPGSVELTCSFLNEERLQKKSSILNRTFPEKTWLNSGIILRGAWRLDEWENRILLLLSILISEYFGGVELTYSFLNEERLQKSSTLNRTFPDRMGACGDNYAGFIPSIPFVQSEKKKKYRSFSPSFYRKHSIRSAIFPRLCTLWKANQAAYYLTNTIFSIPWPNGQEFFLFLINCLTFAFDDAIECIYLIL